MFGCRRRRENFVALQTRSDHILAKYIDERVRLSHRRNVVESQGIDVGEVFEHVAELAGRAPDFLRREIESGQAGHFGDNLC